MAGILDDIMGVKGVRKDGIALVQRSELDFLGAGFTLTDDPATGTTKITLAASGTSLEIKPSCRCATTANVSLSGLGTIDGVALNANDRVFVRAQTTASQNGVYVASAVAWARAPDFDASAEVGPGTMIIVDQGTLYADSVWMVTTNAPIVLGTSALAFKRLDTNDASTIRGIAVSAATPAAGDALLYTSTSAASPGKVANANIATNAAIALSKLAAGSNGQIAKMVAGVPTWATLTTADFGSVEIIQTPSGSVDNWSPAGWATCTAVRMQPSGSAPTINGFAAVTSGATQKKLVNDGSVPVYIRHAAGGQSAGNSIRHATGLTYFVLWPGCSCEVYYSLAAAAWYVVGVDSRTKNGGVLLGNSGEVGYLASDGINAERRSRVLQVDMEAMRGSGIGWEWDDTNARWTHIATGGFYYLRRTIHIPAGGQLSQVRALVECSGSAVSPVLLSCHSVAHDKTSPYAASVTTLIESASAASASGFSLVSISPELESPASDTQVVLRIRSPISGVTGVLHWLDYTILDPGPRNY